MLLFNKDYAALSEGVKRFQNILCYCLTMTSLTDEIVISGFQNILCYCLTKIRRYFDMRHKNFKTSYVTV